MNNKIKSLISLSKRANFLIQGFDMVKEAVLQNSDGVIIVASDIAENTLKKVKSISEMVQIIEVDITKNEVEQLIGKYSGVLYIKDKGLSKKVIDEFSRI